jgi:cellulose biosynthesis protein BcsQ
MKTIAFFNNKGGVGKTSLVYHLAWKYTDLGLSVLAADLDPQANLTSMFLEENRLEELWPVGDHPCTVYGAIKPLLEGTGDVSQPHVEAISRHIGLIAGDLALSSAEDELNSQWPDCLDRKARAFRVISAFWRVLELGAQARNVDVVLIDVGPNLGALNRAALIAAQHVVIPLAPDLYSLQGLNNLGPTLRRWRAEWDERYQRNPISGLSLPRGEMQPAGYVILQHGIRDSRPVQAYQRWMNRIPSTYRTALLGTAADEGPSAVANDPHCLAMLKHYRSLMPLAMEAHKPIFHLKPTDGAIGAHVEAVKNCSDDFKKLAERIAADTGILLPT